MKTYSEYWITTMIRGLIAIVFGTGVLFVPEMATTILLLPFAISISILCLGAYGTIDSALVFVSSFLIPVDRPGRVALRLQGVLGAVVGMLLFALVYDHVGLPWFLYLASAQAAGAAISEFMVARGTAVEHGAKWCYVSAVVAGVSAVALLLGRRLEPKELAWVLYGYLMLFGFNMVTLSARMLFTERKMLRQMEERG